MLKPLNTPLKTPIKPLKTPKIQDKTLPNLGQDPPKTLTELNPTKEPINQPYKYHKYTWNSLERLEKIHRYSNKYIDIQMQVLKLTFKSNIPITAQYCTEKSQI